MKNCPFSLSFNILVIYLSANIAIASCSRVAIFPRDGNAIISENALRSRVKNCSCNLSLRDQYIAKLINIPIVRFGNCNLSGDNLQSFLALRRISMIEGEGGDFLIKVGTVVRRVQNLGRAKFPQKT